MPAAAVIPAPIAYIKVVAVKKLVVGFQACGRYARVLFDLCRLAGPSFVENISAINLVGLGSRSVTVKKLECSKQAYSSEYVSME